MVKLFLDFQRNELDTTIDSGDSKIDSSRMRKCLYACDKYVEAIIKSYFDIRQVASLAGDMEKY